MILVKYLFISRWRAVPFGLALLMAVFAGGGCGSKDLAADSTAALGEVMGKQTAELLGGHGTVVLLVSEAGNEKSEGLAKTIAAFEQALGKSVNVSAVENLQLRTLPGLPPFSPQKFSEVLQKYATADALVSFVMLPVLTTEEVRQLPAPRPKVVLMAGVPSKTLFVQQVVYLAVLPKPGSDSDAKPRTAQAWFDSRYQLITPETATALAY